MFDMPNLLTISDPAPLDTLSLQQLTELQIGLAALGYPIAQVDGMYGPNTRNAWAEFITDLASGNTTLVGPDSINVLSTKTKQIAANLAVPVTDTPSVKNAIATQCRL